ncbi:MAG: tetratricopeptide repeat protein [Rhodospirillaceae bacterium]|nr:tetratricopeptide repeat protein [Rhodospirillaceae bacterium]
MFRRNRSEGMKRILLGAAFVVGVVMMLVLSKRTARWEVCSTAAPDTRITACTAIIESGYEPADGLSRAFSNRGAAFRRQGDLVHAMDDYDQAVHLSDTNSRALHNRAVLYGEQQRYDLALADLDRAIALDPDYANAWNARCWTKVLMGDLSEAVGDCTQSLKLHAADAVTLASRALAYLKLKQPDQAIADYDAALKLTPQSASSLFGRGVAKRMKGDSTGATDIAAAEAINAGVAAQFEKYGVPADVE